MGNLVFNKITIEGNSESINNLLRVVKSEFYDFDPRRICEFYAESKNEPTVYNARIDGYLVIDYVENQEICVIDADIAGGPLENEMKILSQLFPDLKITVVQKSFEYNFQGQIIFQNGIELESVFEDYTSDNE